MDAEEERVLYLTRVGRDKIFKYGTYNIMQERPITQDHPFYVKRDAGKKISYIPPDQLEAAKAGAAAAAANADATAQGQAESSPAQEAEPDPEALAAAVMSSNFKVGLSQEEVDALLNGMV